MMTATADGDRKYMLRALALAREAWGRTAPNPMVGAVVVQAGRIVGEGFHRQAGTPHAEVLALRAAGAAAAGATLYVSLEPCSTYGRTPPCTAAIRQARIARLVAATADPNPLHAGRGFAELRQARIEVKVGVCKNQAIELNKAFFHRITTGRPYVLLKMAMTLDGKIATAAGDSRWVTGPEARARVQELRQWCDAIMVGGETVRCDHPRLTVRDPADWPCQPLKIIYTRMTESALGKLFPGDARVRATAPTTHAEWMALLAELGGAGVNALLIEGGGELAGHAIQAGIVDEVEFHIAPKLLTGRGSRAVVGGENPEALSAAWELDKFRVRRLGRDLIVNGRILHKKGGIPCLPV